MGVSQSTLLEPESAGFRELRRVNVVTPAVLLAAMALLCFGSAWAAPSCPIELGTIEDAKSNKLYLYMPTADDPAFPATSCTLGTAACFLTNDANASVRPLRAFNVSSLSSYTGTVGDLRDAIRDVVIDDYCEFNVKVNETTTVPPTTFARRATIGIGTDSATASGGTLFGEAQEVDIGDAVGVDFARVWAGGYQAVAGGLGGALNGANSTLQRWALSIGGTAAHEAGHTYGLQHNDDFFQNFPSSGCNDGTDQTKPGEDALTRHLMAQGCHFTDEQRAGFRRHFSDVTFSILAANVGLSVETIHNWDFTNPNSASAAKVRFDLLSTASSLTLSWSYGGSLSPWTAPSVSGPVGTTTFRGTVFNRFQVTWSVGKAWANGPSGIVPGGATFHVGAAFSGVDFTQPDPVIVVKVTLLDAGNAELTLQPRMVGYDTGAFDVATGDFRFNLFNADDPTRPLEVRNLVITQLPRVASIDAMVRGGKLISWQGLPINAWTVSQSGLCGGKEVDCTARLAESAREVLVANLGEGRHIAQRFDGKCLEGSSSPSKDASGVPDVNNCPSAGFNLDLFPSTMIFVTATIVDPAAEHWDRATNSFVVGPVESHLFYQFAGQHPDLNRNGVDDYIDIATEKSKDTDRDGVPDEAKRCRRQLGELDDGELKVRNIRIVLADLARSGRVERIERLTRDLAEASERVHRLREEFRECEKL
jgi:hypothetical protein